MATFLSLPVEIRDYIYHDLLSASLNRRINDEGLAYYTFHTNILLVNKQVHREAKEEFLRTNIFVRVQTPFANPESHVTEKGRVKILALGETAKQFKDYLLELNIGTDFERFLVSETFIIPMEELPRFCEMWCYSNLESRINTRLTLDLILRDPKKISSGFERVPRSRQRRLLEHFGLVKDLSSFSTRGFDEGLEQVVREKMAVPYETIEVSLERATEEKNKGNAAIKARKPHLALEHYLKAFEAIHVIVYGRHRTFWADNFYDKLITQGTYAGQHGLMVRVILRIRLVANVIHAYLLLGDYEEAKFWGLRSINMVRGMLGGADDLPRHQFPASAEWGKIYYRTGLACKHLEDTQEARELFRTAAAWLPDSPEVRKEVAATALRLG